MPDMKGRGKGMYEPHRESVSNNGPRGCGVRTKAYQWGMGLRPQVHLHKEALVDRVEGSGRALEGPCVFLAVYVGIAGVVGIDLI